MNLNDAKRMMATMTEINRLARSIHRCDEINCNRTTTPREDARRDRALARIEELAQPYGWRVYHQSDPRGASVYLVERSWDAEMVSSRYNEGLACV
jgi:hypothetical protein